jgi:hypothetical protein
MLSSCLGIGATSLQSNNLLSLSCYKLACYYFLYLLSTLCTHICPISYILLCCSEDEEYFDEDFSRRAKPPVICLW